MALAPATPASPSGARYRRATGAQTGNGVFAHGKRPLGSVGELNERGAARLSTQILDTQGRRFQSAGQIGWIVR